MFLSLLDPDNSEAVIRKFQQGIFGQDSRSSRTSTPSDFRSTHGPRHRIRADKVAIAYRRWLSDLGITYGVIPAAHP